MNNKRKMKKKKKETLSEVGWLIGRVPDAWEDV
jgi:hypothetical protein